MNYLKLENFLVNLSFFLLFASMLYYWIQLVFFSNIFKPESDSGNPLVRSEPYNITNSLDSGNLQPLKKVTNIHYGQLLVFLANLTMLILLLDRWLESGHFPLSNLYESLIFLSWSLTSITLWIEKIQPSGFKVSKKPNKPGPRSGRNFVLRNITTGTKDNKINYIFGGIITPIALIIHAFASFSLPSELREATSLVPALQSNWLIMHVTVIMLSYAALLAGCLFSLVFLLFDIFFSGQQTLNNTIDFKESTIFNYIFKATQWPFNQVVDFEKQSISNRLEFSTTIKVDPKNVTEIAEIDKIPQIHQPPKKTTDIKDVLDNLSYRTIGIGFLLLTIGIFSGAVWANEAWGSYWSWDPKETWALITWLIFAIYLHARLQLNWTRKKAAMIACSGFVVVWICYLGVNLLGQGLHSYGFIKIGK